MKAGIKSNSTYQISQEGLMEQIILKLLEYKFTPIAGLEEFIFRTDCTPKKNYHPNLSYFCPFRNNNDIIIIYSLL